MKYEDIQCVSSKSGMDTLLLEGYYLHSKYNPIVEAKRFFENKYKPYHLHVIFGYGLGYIVDEFVKGFKFNEPIVIIDPLIDEGKIKIKDHDYHNIYFISSTDEVNITSTLNLLASHTTKVNLIDSINYKNLFLDHFMKLGELVKKNQYNQILNINTTRHFNQIWHINKFLNIPYAFKDLSVDNLDESIDAPVVVASAGPSLTKQIELLKINREKVILVCSGSAINALLKNDIRPDFVVSIDGGEANYDHFKGLDNTGGISLVYSCLNNFKIRRIFNEKNYVFIPTVREELQAYYKKIINKEIGLLKGGGSVANFAFEFAKRITKGPVCLIGQDLALSNNRTHAEGSLHNNLNKGYTNEENIVYLDGYYGEKVKSNFSFQSMLKDFEVNIKAENREDIYNCTEGGVNIKGLVNIPFINFLDNFANEVVVKKSLILNNHCEANEIDMSKLINEEIKNYNHVIKLLDEGLKIANLIGSNSFTESKKKKLVKIERDLNKMYNEFGIDILLEPILNECNEKYLAKIDESEKERNNRAKSYTVEMYSKFKNELNSIINKFNEEIINWIKV